jgi:hypothetical protein
MKLFDKFFKKEPTIRFKSYVGNFSVNNPVIETWKLKSDWMKKQSKDNRFTKCPGMLDYHMTGYIITAYTDIHIKANKVGMVIQPEITSFIDPIYKDFLKPAPFEYKMVEGMTHIGNDVVKGAHKVPLPWAIFTKPGYSAYVLPALMHSDFLDKIFVYPGVVDYEHLHTVNFIFSAIKECEFTIPAGTPLLQIIPFKREKITAECGKATEMEKDEYLFAMGTKAIKNYYRRFLSERKSFKMKCPYEHPQYKDKK